VTVRAYFTKDLPPPYSSQARYVHDLLDEYAAHGHGNFSYEFVDPLSEETDADKEKKKEVRTNIFGQAVREATTIERELQRLGIPPVQVRVNDEDRVEVKRAYMGLAVAYGDKTEVLPVVQETAGLEYDLTTLIRKVARAERSKIALVVNSMDDKQQQAFSRVKSLWTQLYDVSTIDMASTTTIPEGVKAIIVIGAKTPYSDAAKKALDAFVMSGKSAAFLVDAVKPDLSTLQSEDADAGLSDLLASYGVTIKPGLVLDEKCATVNITQQRGFMRITQPVRYPFLPLVNSLSEKSPVTRGLGQVAFPFVSPLAVTAADQSNIKAEVLVHSSEHSWTQAPPYNLDPMQEWTLDRVQDPGAKSLVVALSGALKSPYGAGANAVSLSSDSDKNESTVNARVLVIGGSAFMTDQFMAKPNEALVLNMTDWLVLDDDLLTVRTRGLAAAPLRDLSASAKSGVKYANIVGVPLAFVGLGLWRWRRREAQRKDVRL
jgi:gliding-associated putative ABC transporter substrate-binding component GldG